MKQIGKLTKWFLVFACIAILSISYSFATTIYVATTGNDTWEGTEQAPLLTVQAGINKAIAGDTVFVKQGVYRERINFPSDGSSGNPITLKGELNPTTGDKLAIIDGGTLVTGWERVSGDGNVWRTPSDNTVYVGDFPMNLNFNNYYILNITISLMGTPEGMNALRYGPLGWDKTYGDSNRYRSWTRGITTLWGCPTTENFLYIGFGDPNINPNNETITTTRRGKSGGAAILIDGRNFITVRDLCVRNAYNPIFIRHNSTDCLIENNELRGGQATVAIWEGSSRIVVKNNFITLDFDNGNTLSSDSPNHWFLWDVFKNSSDHDRIGVNMTDLGSDVDICGNYIYEHWDGVQDTGTSNNLRVRENVIENVEDDGLEPTGDETNAQWNDNTIIRADYAYRHKSNAVGPMYVYRNKFYSETEGGIYWFTGKVTPAYFYHNTFATDRGSNFGSADGAGLPNVWLINNIFSCWSTVFSDSSSWDAYPKPNIINNYFGGNLSAKLSWWGDGNVIVNNGQLWTPPGSVPDFKLTPTSSAREIGIDLSQPWTVGNKTFPALPGMLPGYFSGLRPDAGAEQYKEPVLVTIDQALNQADPTYIPTIKYSVVFSKAVTGFDSSDIVLSGTALPASAIVTDSGDHINYLVAVSGMTQSGTVIASVKADGAKDIAGNLSEASSSIDNVVNYTYDVTSPTVTINQKSSQADPASNSPILFDVVFSEAVSGFDKTDITVTGTAQATNIVVTNIGNHKNFLVSISGMTKTGTVIVSVKAGAAQDKADNLSIESTSIDNSVSYILLLPTVTINQAETQQDATNQSPINFTAVFNKAVTGFTSASIIITGTANATTAVVTNTGDHKTFNVAISGMKNSGTVIASIPANGSINDFGEGNLASTSVDNIVTYNLITPSLVINQASSQNDPTTNSSVLFTAVFSEAVTGLTGSDVIIGGTSQPSSVSITDKGDHKTYTISVSGMIKSGTVTASIGAGAAQNITGNSSAASVSIDNIVSYNMPDGTSPTVTINQSSSQKDPTIKYPILFEVRFSEVVSGFDANDVLISGSALAEKAIVTDSGDHKNFTVKISRIKLDGTVIASIKAGAAKDSSGNDSMASTSTDNKVDYTIDQNSFLNITSPTKAEFYDTNTKILNIGGNASANVSRVKWLNALTKKKGSCSGKIAWSAKKITLALGENIITVTGTYKKTKVTQTDTLAVYYTDKTAPKVTIKSPSSKGLYTSTKPLVSISGSAIDLEKVTTVSWKNETTGTSGTCTGTKSWKGSIPLTLGLNNIVVNAADNSGNVGTASINITLKDIKKPTVSINIPTKSSTYKTAQTTISLSGIAADDIGIKSVRWFDGANNVGICDGLKAWTSSVINLAVGKNVITVEVTDTSNNIGKDIITITRT